MGPKRRFTSTSEVTMDPPFTPGSAIRTGDDRTEDTQLHERLSNTNILRRRVAVPLANPLTIDHLSNTVAEALDSANPNMNRAWPGDFGGSLHERMCAPVGIREVSRDRYRPPQYQRRPILPRQVHRGRTHSTASRAFGSEILVGHSRLLSQDAVNRGVPIFWICSDFWMSSPNRLPEPTTRLRFEHISLGSHRRERPVRRRFIA